MLTRYQQLAKMVLPNNCERSLVLSFGQTDRADQLAGSTRRISGVSVNKDETSLALVDNTGQLFSADLSAMQLSSRVENGTTIAADMQTIQLQCTAYEKHWCGIEDMAAAVWLPLLVTLGTDRTIHVWDFRLKKSTVVCQYAEQINCLDVHPFGHYVVVGTDSEIWLLTLATEKLRRFACIAMDDVCHKVTFSHGGHLIATATCKTIRILCFVTRSWLLCLEGHSKRVVSIDWMLRDDEILTSDTSGVIYRWRASDGNKIKEYKVENETAVCATRATPSGQNTFLAFEDSSVITEVCFDSESQRNFRCSKYGRVTHIGLDQTAQHLIVATSSGHIISRNVCDSPEVEWSAHHAHQTTINKIIALPYSEFLASCCQDGLLVLWKFSAENKSPTFDQAIIFSDEILVTQSEYAQTVAQLKQLTEAAEKNDVIKLQLFDVQKHVHQADIVQLNNDHQRTVFNFEQQIQEMQQKMDDRASEYEKQLANLSEANEKNITSMRLELTSKLAEEYQKQEQLENTIKCSDAKFKEQLECEALQHQKELEALETDFRAQIADKQREIENITDKHCQLKASVLQRELILTEICDEEQCGMVAKHDSHITALNKQLVHYQEEIAFGKLQLSRTEQEITSSKVEIDRLSEDVRKKTGQLEIITQDSRKLNKILNETKHIMLNKEKDIERFKNLSQVQERAFAEQKSEVEQLKQQLISEKEHSRSINLKNRVDASKLTESECKRRTQGEQIRRVKQCLATTLSKLSRARATLQHYCEQHAVLQQQLSHLGQIADRPAQVRLHLKVLLELNTSILRLLERTISTGEEPSEHRDVPLTSPDTSDGTKRAARVIASLKRQFSRNSNVMKSKLTQLTQENLTFIEEINRLRDELRSMEKHMDTAQQTINSLKPRLDS